MKIIALLTDFGENDPFVGVMKGVMLSLNPHVTIVDLTHGIPPGDIGEAAFILKTSLAYFPKGTLFVIVVDPGVGSERKILYAKTSSFEFLAPDNGVLQFILEESSPIELIHVQNSDYFLHPVSHTFQGRDIFAPVAGHLSKGLDPKKLGPVLAKEKLVSFPFPKAYRDRNGIWHGEVIYIDRFGNLITNFFHPEIDLQKNAIEEIGIKDMKVRDFVKNYREQEGRPVVLMNSFDAIEIAFSQGNAATFFNVKKGEKVTLKCRTSSF